MWGALRLDCGAALRCDPAALRATNAPGSLSCWIFHTRDD